MLKQIVADKRVAVAARTFPGAEGLERSDRSLLEALSRPRTGFILECKRRSPSRGVLREDYDPVAIAKVYAGHADAISVLCDEPYFGGHLEHLEAVRAAVDVPVLCKEFIVDPRQILEARRYGADAVLLMASVLSQDELVECLGVATEWGLDALVEVHDEAELARALEADAKIIGINNRDLTTLEVDRGNAARLAPTIPREGRVIVGESGMRHHGDVRELREHVDAFLVGSSMMSRDDLATAVRELIYGRVKICGLTRPEDAVAAWEAGACFGGLVLWDGSKRHRSVEVFREVVAAAPLQWVGVFVDATVDDMVAAVHDLALAAVQLHGDASRETVDALRERLPAGCAIWKVRQGEDGATERAADWGADRLLLDATVGDGGKGHAFDWALAKDHPERGELVLAGGIGVHNAAEADAVGAWALDLSSGVEAAPGVKDEAKLRALFGALRGTP